MVNYDLVLFGVFIVLLVAFYIKKRKKIQFQAFGLIAMYRTKLGINLSKKIVRKSPAFFRYAGYIGIVVGFIGMILMFYILLRGSIDIFLNPEAAPVVAPVLPFVKIPGLPPLLFTYWILGIFVVAAIHEFSHALLSVAHKVKVKSSGFAFFGPIPAAFVEPDEKQLQKRSKSAQLSIFAAGPFANIITGIIFFVIFAFLLSPPILAIADVSLKISDVVEDSPAEVAGIEEGVIIQKINGIKTTRENIVSIISELKPDETLTIESPSKTFTLKTGKHPENETRGYIGISIETQLDAKEEGDKTKLNALIWIQRLFFWLFVLSLGIGLFNLLPLGPIDGGKMLFIALTYFSKNETVVKRIFTFISFISLLALIISFSPWIFKFFGFLGRIG